MVDLLIRNARVLTMDAAGTDIPDGAIAVSDGRITDIGDSAVLAARYKSARVIDARGMVALPGLINTHMHVCYCLLKGIGSDIDDRIDWLSAVYPYVLQCGPDECYHAARLGCLEMIRGGTTFFVENNPFIADPGNTDAIARAVLETGMRAAIGRMFSDINAPDFLLNSSEEFRTEMERLHKEWQGAGDGRVSVWVYTPGPGIRESVARMRQTLEIVAKYDSHITSHWAEGGEGDNYFQKHYGTAPPTRFLEENGYLRPNSLLVHTVHMNDEEIEMLARSGTPVAHCPVSNSIRAGQQFGIAPISDMLAAGVTVGLGTDASICNDKASMFEAMKMAVMLQKLRQGSPRALTARQALEMATVNGAKAVGMEREIGSLEKGKQADIILLNVDKPHIQPLHNIYENIVYCANETDVDTVIVGGRILMENCEVNTVNAAEVLDQAVSVTRDLDQRARARASEIAEMWQRSVRQRD